VPALVKEQRTAPFPSRRRITKTASRDSPPETAQTALQARRQRRSREPPTSRDAACGRRLDPTIACDDGRWTMALDCTGRVTPSEGPPLPPPAAAGRRGRRFPSSRELPEHPFLIGRRSFVRRAGLSLRPLGPTEALVPTSPREGQRFPEGRGAFHRQEFGAAGITPHVREPALP